LYWTPKLQRNVRRDAEHQKSLAGLGWKVLIFWECEVKDKSALAKRIGAFLGK
jgi:DNA mismatch endonuclease, patch repair protein